METNSTVVATGTASDNVAVALVAYRLENASGTNAYQAANGTTSWSAAITGLVPGANTVRAVAFDTSTNMSSTVTRTFDFVIMSPLTLTTFGNGSVSGARNGELLGVNLPYKITAKPASGFVFNGWTGDIVANTPTLSFLMHSNLVLHANFRDNTKPALTITTPKSGLRVANALFAVTGTANDNVSVSNVFYQYDGQGWMVAATLNHWAIWSAPNLTLVPGANSISAYAVDSAGNFSKTNTVKFTH
jgi:uncharacterized repeat protein (TIGR02543 family)